MMRVIPVDVSQLEVGPIGDGRGGKPQSAALSFDELNQRFDPVQEAGTRIRRHSDPVGTDFEPVGLGRDRLAVTVLRSDRDRRSPLTTRAGYVSTGHRAGAGIDASSPPEEWTWRRHRSGTPAAASMPQSRTEFEISTFRSEPAEDAAEHCSRARRAARNRGGMRQCESAISCRERKSSGPACAEYYHKGVRIRLDITIQNID